jgi:transposase-like protein
MFVFPIGELMDEGACLGWLEQQLHPAGLRCPRCSSTNRREFRMYQAFPSYRCRDCQRPYTVVTGTAFEKTRQRPSTIVLLLRGVTQGVSTMQLSEELDLSYKQTHTLRKRLQDNANETAPQSQMEGREFEADEVYQNAGEKKRRPYRPRRPATLPGQQPAWARNV